MGGLFEVRGAPHEQLEAHAEREREAMAHLSPDANGIRHLRSTYLRQDELLFSLFEGPSLEAVREAIERAGVPFERITEAIDLSLDGRELPIASRANEEDR